LLHEEGRARLRDSDSGDALTADERGPDAPLVRQALYALSDRDRSALLMSEEGLTYHEIAAALGLSVPSVGTTLTRARHRLMHQYEILAKAHAPGGTNVKR
jgi:DNA-directed RNA polymerase specialized sigma24 family protein